MSKNKHASKNSNSVKRLPPSIPKTVKKDAKLNGYVTDVVSFGNENVKFLFKKESEGYITSKMTTNDVRWLDMRSEKLSPTTRTHFSPQSTLTKAIINLEEYLHFKLPDVR